jgi:UDP-GlcNAc:undecaprenyl-phosphate/decaprenyl-phosphate GlcNAc-1-phosphate transferase
VNDLNPFLVFTLAVAASMLVVPFVARLAPRLGLLDVPDSRKVHSAPVPRVGGFGIFAGIAIPALLVLPLDPLLESFLAGAVALFAVGVWDDAREIGHWPKFGVQIVAAATVVYYGGLYVSRVPFLNIALAPEIGKPFTTFAFVGAINAINHSDGLDGLAGGESLLSLIAIAVLGYVVGDPVVVVLALATVGGILGFLRYNSHPARVFMGDCGSQVLGFMLGFLVVYLTQVAYTAVSAALPLLLLGLPIADILVVLLKRIRGSLHWFKATRNHVHHRLLDLGFDHFETVVVIYSFQALLVVSAVALRYESDLTVALTYLIAIGTLFGGLVAAEHAGWRLRQRSAPVSRLTAAAARLAAHPLVSKLPLIAISTIVPAFMLLGTLWVATIPRDFAIVAAVLAAVVTAELLRSRGASSVLVRGAIYVTAIFSAYLIVHYPGTAGPPVQAATATAIAALAVAIAFYVRVSSEQRFGTTPTDYLIAFGVLALTAFGSVDIYSRPLAELIAYATVLLYGCEVVINRFARRFNLLHASTLASLAIMAARGVL